MRIKVLSKRFKGDESGAILIIAALMLTVLMGFMALGIDIGVLYFQQKTLQTRADLAAVSAASNLKADPRTRAIKTIEGNGLEEGSLTAIEYGRFIRDPELPPEDRLAARDLSDTDVNAARVTLTTQAPLYFAKIFLDEDTTRIRAEATAARYDTASFSLGSRLVRINAGILNRILSETLDTTVGIDVLDYEALADADVDLLAFSDALATRLDVTVGNYEDLFKKEADLADIAGALLDTGLAGGSATALTTLANAAASRTFNISKLIQLKGDDVTAQAPDLLPKVTVRAIDLLKASADIINTGRIVDMSLDHSIPGLISIDFDLLIGERLENSGWITIGERGATLHTAQTRLKLDLKFEPNVLAGLNSGLSIASIHLPVYIEVASATATLSSLDCSASKPDDIVAHFDTVIHSLNGVTGTHAAKIFLGKPDKPKEFDDVRRMPATLLDLNVVPGLLDASITINEQVPLGLSSQEEVAFTLDDLSKGGENLRRPIGTGHFLESATTALISNSKLRPGDGLLNVIFVAVQSFTQPILQILLAPLDKIIDELLESLGIGIAQADLFLHGVACDRLLLAR